MRNDFVKHRGIAAGTKGMVSSAHNLISVSGLRTLEKGGNAMDACVAMALTAGIVLPDMCGPGGDAFALYYDAASDHITALNGSGRLPKRATVEEYTKRGYQKVPNEGMLSVTVPGAVDMYFTALEKFGTITFAEAAHDAVKLAREGVPMAEKVIRHCHGTLPMMLRHENLAAAWLNNGSSYGFGDVVRLPEYADFLEEIGEKGRDEFYKGSIAEQIVDYSHRHDGLLELEDFAEHSTVITEPISVNYRGYKVYQTPPVSLGIEHLEEMAILDHFDLAQYGPDSAEAVHLMVEAKKLAFHDAEHYFGDPEFVTNPVIFDPERIKELAEMIRMDRSLEDIDLNEPDMGHTTSMIAVDRYGNACSFITSISGVWGSGEMVDGTGMLLNNRAPGAKLEPGHPNCLRPSGRVMHTLNTWMMRDADGRLCFVGNTPGGDRQPQWNMQTIVNLVDFKLDVQTALEHAKWHDATDREKGKHVLRIEEQIGAEEIEKLRAMGHETVPMKPFAGSGASQVIQIREDGVRLGGSDPRADGAALAEV
ncbi:MAG: gamma-glutamyltransferase family protein [Solobacterium sp.]|nr:gamma-glutamyltransferase family protein [Solobacterium sp.]